MAEREIGEKRLLKGLMEKIDQTKVTDIVTKDFGKTLSKKYEFKRMVGVFSKFGTLPTSDMGDVLAENTIKRLAKDITKLGFVAITCFYIADEDGVYKTPIIKLWDDLEESESRAIDFSICLASSCYNAIIIVNSLKGSTTIHEMRAFHKNHRSNMCLCVLFSLTEKIDCLLLKKHEKVSICTKTEWRKCILNTKCPFRDHISDGNKEPLIRSKKFILGVVSSYKSIIPLFKETVISQKILTYL